MTWSSDKWGPRRPRCPQLISARAAESGPPGAGNRRVRAVGQPQTPHAAQKHRGAWTAERAGPHGTAGHPPATAASTRSALLPARTSQRTPKTPRPGQRRRPASPEHVASSPHAPRDAASAPHRPGAAEHARWRPPPRNAEPARCHSVTHSSHVGREWRLDRGPQGGALGCGCARRKRRHEMEPQTVTFNHVHSDFPSTDPSQTSRDSSACSRQLFHSFTCKPFSFEALFPPPAPAPSLLKPAAGGAPPDPRRSGRFPRLLRTRLSHKSRDFHSAICLPHALNSLQCPLSVRDSRRCLGRGDSRRWEGMFAGS